MKIVRVFCGGLESVILKNLTKEEAEYRVICEERNTEGVWLPWSYKIVEDSYSVLEWGK